jgi:thymidylate synthase ThyX
VTATAKVITDSVSPEGIRLTTLQLRYPRMVHGEFLTHRALSRNGRSSRAVPFSVLVKEEPYVPHFMKNKPGMVATEEFGPAGQEYAQHVWLKAVTACKEAAQELSELKVHKQWVNRMLEWFGYIDVLVTSTEWANFHALRDDEGAQPEIRAIAVAIKDAMDGSKPIPLEPGEWHLPYIDNVKDFEDVIDWQMTNTSEFVYADTLELVKKVSVARCARLTIKPFDGDGSIEKELDRFEKLMVSRPVHASPAEHIATPDSWINEGKYDSGGYWKNKHEHGNFTGWRQFRKQIANNTVY